MSETRTCPRCGAPILADQTPAGLCAACLMKMGFDSRSGAAEVVLTEGESAQRPPAPTIEELAPHFPELEIVELVGRGGMGAVYRARQRSLARDVALKILTVGTGDATFADRFQREARTLATLSHPAITAVFDFGQRGPWSFLAMEFVEGASLRQMLRARELGPRESLAIVSQMCDALQYAHDKGVVHRDIKPENVLVTRDGRVKLLDFGLAKLVGTAQRDNLTQAKQVMGTPHYMAPEQWEKPLTVDHRADIYAMGVVFYELLTGELPIGRFAPPSQKVAVDVRLDDVVLRSLEKEPDRRYQHASQVKDDVAGITSTPGGVPPPIPAQPTRKRSAGHKWLIAGSAVGCLLLLLVPAAFLSFFVMSRSELAGAQSREMAAAADAHRLAARENGREAQTNEGELRDLEIEIAHLSEQMSDFKPQHPRFRELSELLDAKRARRDQLQRLEMKGNVETAPETEVETAQPQATQQADRAAAYAYVNAYLNSRRDSLAITAEVADKLGIPADRVADLNRDLQRVWTSYLEWEASGVRLRWIGPDVLEADTSVAGVRPPSLLKDAEVAISRATVRSALPYSAYQTLMRFAERQMFFGTDNWVRFELTIRNQTAIVKRIEDRGQTKPGNSSQSVEAPPSVTMQRIWDRAVAQRDAQPK